VIRLIDDPWESVDLQPCCLRPCETNIGLAPEMPADIDDGSGWTPFYEVTSPGEPAARFCVECGDWLRDAMALEVAP
jgi:hypothetical protein